VKKKLHCRSTSRRRQWLAGWQHSGRPSFKSLWTAYFGQLRRTTTKMAVLALP